VFCNQLFYFAVPGTMGRKAPLTPTIINTARMNEAKSIKPPVATVGPPCFWVYIWIILTYDGLALAPGRMPLFGPGAHHGAKVIGNALPMSAQAMIFYAYPTYCQCCPVKKLHTTI